MSSSDLAPAQPAILIPESTILRPRSAAPEFRLIAPASRWDVGRFTELTLILRIVSLVGNPSGFTLPVVTEYRQDHTDSWQYTRPVWFPAPESDHVGGAGFGTITQTGVYKRTLRYFPTGVRLNLEGLAFDGGSSPGLRASLIAYPKG